MLSVRATIYRHLGHHLGGGASRAEAFPEGGRLKGCVHWYALWAAGSLLPGQAGRGRYVISRLRSRRPRSVTIQAERDLIDGLKCVDRALLG